MNILIIDVGISNLSSLCNCLNFLGANFKIINNKKDLNNGTHVILPGVGSFDEFIKALDKKDLFESIKYNVLINKLPILGICIGFQALFKKSEEGNLKGLGLLNGEVKKLFLNKKTSFKVPNVGFRRLINFNKKNFFKEIKETDAFYFMHSYACFEITDKYISCAYSEHNKNFIAALQKKNIFGLQFHPEKSQASGLKLLKNFIEI